jgi:steroid delta-isomerase-like uncharacterized protein
VAGQVDAMTSDGITDDRSTHGHGAAQHGKVVVRRHFDEVLNQGRLDVIPELYTTDYVLDAPVRSDGTTAAQGTTLGQAGLAERVTLFRTAFPDIHFGVDTMVAEGDQVAVRYRFRGTHRGRFLGFEPTGHRIDVAGMLIATLVDGRIDAAWSVFDSAQLLQQLRGESPVTARGGPVPTPGGSP